MRPAANGFVPEKLSREMMARLLNIIRRSKGQSLVEYVLIISLIAIILIVSLNALGATIVAVPIAAIVAIL